MVGIGKNTVEIIIAARDRTRAAFAKVNTQMRTLGTSSTRLNAGMGTLKGSFTNLRGAAGKLATTLGPLGLAAVAAAAAIAIASIGVAAVKAFAEFEDAMASVRKTTGFTKAEIKVLGDAINDLALRIPVAQTELAGIAAVAGQLGIQGKADILSFTETVAMMTTAFDMSAESVAIAMAKLGKIYDVPIEQTSNLGSAINYLGNTTAASEPQLLAFSMALGPTGQQLGFTATEVLSLGASMISMGMDASNAGTRLNRAFSMIGRNLEELAEFMEIPVDEFVQSFEEMPMDAFLSVVDKLSQVEGKLKANTIAAKVFGEIGGKAIKSIAEDVDGIRTNLINTNTAFVDNTSLSDEFAAKTDTLNAKFKIFGNTVNSFKIQIGEALAPLTGKLTEVATTAVKGLGLAFDAMMKIAGPALDLIFIKVKLLRAFLEGLFTPLLQALAPLKNSLESVGGGFSKLKGVVTLVSDVVTILTTAATKLGTLLGNLLVKVLTPLIAKTQDGIGIASGIYDKLGPIKEAVDTITSGIHDLAEAQEDLIYDTKAVMDSVDEMAKSLEELEASAVSAPTAIIKAWKTATDAFEEGTGNMKDAASAINKEIEIQIGLWKQATAADKFYYEDNLTHLGEQLRAIEAADKAERDYLDTFINGTSKAIKETKEFIITIGNTTIEFKGAAAEVVKNADAYAKLQDSAQTLIDLDWSVFTEFEASLPRIDAGLGNMESSFVGLKGVLKENIDKLENIQEAIIAINEIATPFLEEGFLKGIDSIGKFASTLKTAGGAINDFSSLQDVSIEGCINFSLHVRDMVSALQILEDQMEDLVPSFTEMNLLIGDIIESFIYSGGKGETFANDLASNFDSLYSTIEKDLEGSGKTVEEFFTYIRKLEGEHASWGLTHSWSIAEKSKSAYKFLDKEMVDSAEKRNVLLRKLMDDYGFTYDQGLVVMRKYFEEGEDAANDFANSILSSSTAVNTQLNKQTSALSSQTNKLKQITDALQPYLEFMRTLNELAALSTLSTEALNSGLNAIRDTLVNLGTALNSFDLSGAMEGLFDPETGSAKGFMDVMGDYNVNFGLFATTLTRITEVIGNLSVAMANAADMVVISSHDMEEAMKLIPAQLGEIAIFLSSDIWKDIVSSISAVNTEWLKFEDTLETTSFSRIVSTISDLLRLMESLKSTFLETGEQVVISSTEMADTLKLLPSQLGELAVFLGTDLWKDITKGISAVDFSWDLFSATLEDTDFSKISSTFSDLIGLMNNLKGAFSEIEAQVVISAKGMEEALSKIPEQLGEIAVFLGSDLWGAIVQSVSAADFSWNLYAKTIEEEMPSFNAAVDTIATLASKVLSLSESLSELRDMTVLSVRDIDEALKNIPLFLDGFVDALALNMVAIKESLKELDIEWAKHAEEMEATMPAYEDSTDKISKLIGSLLSLNSALVQLSEMGTISGAEFDKGFSSLMESITNFAGSLSKNVDGLVESLQHLVQVWVANEATLVPLMRDFMTITENFYAVANNANAMADAFRDLQENSVSLEKGFESLIDFINQVVKGTKEFYTPEAADELASFIRDVDKVIKSFVDLEIELKGAMATIKTAIGKAVEDIEVKIRSLDNLVKDAFYWGANMMVGFINGIYSMENDLALAAARMAGIVEDYLGAASPTKLGPLSNLDKWPQNLVQSYSSGIEAEMTTLNSSFRGLAPGMSAGSAGGGNKKINLYVTNHISDRDTADYANHGLERLLQKHAVM